MEEKSMKKYFAKQLVVPAEWGGSATKNVGKLFLCSRDVQEGDEVYKNGINNPLGKALKVAHDGIYGMMAIYELEDGRETSDYCKDLFKVVGSISPKATWIKEGDEFIAEGKDCQIFPLHNHKETTGEIYYVDEHGDKVDTPIYIIKCPTCGNFK